MGHPPSPLVGPRMAHVGPGRLHLTPLLQGQPARPGFENSLGLLGAPGWDVGWSSELSPGCAKPSLGQLAWKAISASSLTPC